MCLQLTQRNPFRCNLLTQWVDHSNIPSHHIQRKCHFPSTRICQLVSSCSKFRSRRRAFALIRAIKKHKKARPKAGFFSLGQHVTVSENSPPLWTVRADQKRPAETGSLLQETPMLERNLSAHQTMPSNPAGQGKIRLCSATSGPHYCSHTWWLSRGVCDHICPVSLCQPQHPASDAPLEPGFCQRRRAKE